MTDVFDRLRAGRSEWRRQRGGSRNALTLVGIATGLVALHAVEPAALDAAQAILDEFAHGRVIGKLLGDRRVSGDVTGLARGSST